MDFLKGIFFQSYFSISATNENTFSNFDNDNLSISLLTDGHLDSIIELLFSSHLSSAIFPQLNGMNGWSIINKLLKNS